MMAAGHETDPTWSIVEHENWAKAFLAWPVPQPPGSLFVYNSGATYMLSAIVHNNLKEIGGQVLLIQPGWMKTWLSGKYRDDGPMTPDIPAAKLAEMIDDPSAYRGDHPAYIDYEGNPLDF